MRRETTPLEHTAIGAFAGLVEVSIMQPTVALKNALQAGRALPTSPAALYRGYTVNATTIAPICAIQFGANRAYEQAFRRVLGEDMGALPRIAAAAAAGGTSTIVGCPAELLMIRQQQSGRPLMAEFRNFVSQYGFRRLYHGMGVTVLRESTYSTCYLGLAPILREYLEKQPAVRDLHPAAPLLLSGTTAGIISALATQPPDTVKTRMQAFMDVEKNPEYRSYYSTIRHLVNTRGITVLWAGLLPRSVRIIGATFILLAVRNKCVEVLEGRTQEEVIDEAEVVLRQ